MSMVPFFTRFGDLAFRETRFARIQGEPGIPDGEYAFLELYCDDPDCDCRRVLIDVVAEKTGTKIWATINYGWESPSYYETWTENKEDAEAMSGAVLDPLNPQTRYSKAFLNLFHLMIEDRAYVERLKRHYRMFKRELKREGEGKQSRKPTAKGKRPKKT